MGSDVRNNNNKDTVNSAQKWEMEYCSRTIKTLTAPTYAQSWENRKDEREGCIMGKERDSSLKKKRGTDLNILVTVTAREICVVNGERKKEFIAPARTETFWLRKAPQGGSQSPKPKHKVPRLCEDSFRLETKLSFHARSPRIRVPIFTVVRFYGASEWVRSCVTAARATTLLEKKNRICFFLDIFTAAFSFIRMISWIWVTELVTSAGESCVECEYQKHTHVSELQ